ncbi:hypothetical protein GGX14DRAFT_367173 [Mycena pura]|uniref:Ubiquitin carboxyl-terminal hydrolase n=1 Tax=Mycena pura TaxID=153505 RepID=A0AAD6YF34_9AGAR|nr:hypothetical protein GGX14DRAFT_367173 [Mycena pura]
MAKGKTPSPQELYRARKQREEQEKLALLPPGLFNHGNTCFMNSVLQGLIATRLLSLLVHFAPIPASIQAHSATPLVSHRSPQLTNGHNIAGEREKKWVNTMPIGDSFLNVIHRAWDVQYHQRRENLSPKPLLSALGKKYDQYLDFAQQDAHEFLRILLDAMSMEELDVIKKSHPQPPKKRRRTSVPARPPDDAPMSLADMIFGGKLASILVCQKCKHVSHTYEDFNDLSLSIKQEDYPSTGARKRDRLKLFAKRLGTVVSLGASGDVQHTQRASSVPPSPRERPDGLGDLEAAATATDESRRRSLDLPPEEAKEERDEHPVRLNGVSLVITPDEKHIEFMDLPSVEKRGKPLADAQKAKKDKDDDAWAKLGRRLSLGLATKKEKARKGRSKERVSRDFISTVLTSTAAASETPRSSMSEQAPEIRVSRVSMESGATTPKSRPTTPSLSSVRGPSITVAAPQPVVPTLTTVSRSKSPKPPKPTAAETEYLRQILADVTTGGDAAWLKLGGGLPGVEECLRMFTAVEVLDGENMVGCRRCWKIANGEYIPRARGPDEECANEDGDSEESVDHHESPAVPAPIVVEAPTPHNHTHRPPLPTSISSPVISTYSRSDIKSRDSVSSLPLVTPPSSSSDSALGRSRFGDDTDTMTPPSSASSVNSLSLSLSSERQVETPPGTQVAITPPTPNAPAFDFSGRGATSLLNSTEPPHLNGAESADLVDTRLLPPRVHHHHQRHLSDESANASSEDESDVSPTSTQVSSTTVSEDNRSDVEARNVAASVKPRAKPAKKPKPVIMRPAYKRYLVAVPPPVLVIHLKRFQQVLKSMMSFSSGFKKLDDYVTFPEMLDLTPFLAPKKEDYGLQRKKGAGRLIGKRPVAERCMYRLYAVVVHIGNMLGGHYISYVALPTADDIASIPGLNPATGTSTTTSSPASPLSEPPADPSAKQERQWAYVSDTVVRLTTLEEVLKARAYICMYERV